jgi:hypothetical protein
MASSFPLIRNPREADDLSAAAATSAWASAMAGERSVMIVLWLESTCCRATVPSAAVRTNAVRQAAKPIVSWRPIVKDLMGLLGEAGDGARGSAG